MRWALLLVTGIGINSSASYNTALNQSTDVSLSGSGNSAADIILPNPSNKAEGDEFVIYIRPGRAQRCQMYITGSPSLIRTIGGTTVIDYYFEW